MIIEEKLNDLKYNIKDSRHLEKEHIIELIDILEDLIDYVNSEE